jgi:hypothetical protein
VNSEIIGTTGEVLVGGVAQAVAMGSSLKTPKQDTCSQLTFSPLTAGCRSTPIMARKRKAPEEDDFDRVYAALPERSIQALRDLPSSEAALFLAQLADLLEVKNRDFKNARVPLPYFSSTKWAHVGGQYNLPVTFPSNGRLSLENTSRIPGCYLPPSFHEAVFQLAWKTADVYLDLPDQHTEAARSRDLDPVSPAF